MNVINKFLKETKTFQLFIDLDGVLCDWDGGFIKISGGLSADDYSKKHGDSAMWKLIGRYGLDWWAHLKWTVDGKELWKFVRPYNPIILSKPSRDQKSKIGKKIWIERELGMKQQYIFERDKSKYADKNSILIDDMIDNIYPSQQKGGFGILPRSTKETISRLKNIL